MQYCPVNFVNVFCHCQERKKEKRLLFFLFIYVCTKCSVFFFNWPGVTSTSPRWGSVDDEIKVISAEILELSNAFSTKTWSRSKCSFAYLSTAHAFCLSGIFDFFLLFHILFKKRWPVSLQSNTILLVICWAVFPRCFFLWFDDGFRLRMTLAGEVGFFFSFSFFLFLLRILLTNHVYKYAHTRWGGRWMWDQQDPVATEPQHPVSRKEPCPHVSHARRLLDCDQHPSGQSAHCYVQVIITVMFTWQWPFLWSICSLLCSDKYNSNVYLTDQYSSGQSAPFCVQLTMMSASTLMWLRCVCCSTKQPLGFTKRNGWYRIFVSVTLSG